MPQIPFLLEMPWRRQWHPTPVLLPGKSHGRRSMVGYSPWGHKELDKTEWLHFHFHFFNVLLFNLGVSYKVCLLHIIVLLLIIFGTFLCMCYNLIRKLKKHDKEIWGTQIKWKRIDIKMIREMLGSEGKTNILTLIFQGKWTHQMKLKRSSKI